MNYASLLPAPLYPYITHPDSTDYTLYCFPRPPTTFKGVFTVRSNSSNPLACLMINFYADPTTECLAKTSNIAQIIFSGAFTIVVSFYTRIMCRYVHIMFRCTTVYEGSVYKSNSCVELYRAVGNILDSFTSYKLFLKASIGWPLAAILLEMSYGVVKKQSVNSAVIRIYYKSMSSKNCTAAISIALP